MNSKSLSEEEMLLKVASHCHLLLKKTISNFKLMGDAQKGILFNLEMLYRHMRLVRSLENGKQPRIIGVFGPPKRGKSTLLNAMLGVDILPMGRSPKSNTVIEIHSSQDMKINEWLVQITEEDGETSDHPLVKSEDVLNLIENRGAYNLNAPNQRFAKKIKVIGNFPNSEIFKRNAILLDTPGAEAAFDESVNPQLAEDSRRAIKMLDSTHIVLFVTRADQMESAIEKEFFDKHLKMLNPLNLVNFIDKWGEEENEPKREASNAYGFPLSRTLAVSSKFAHEAKEEKEWININSQDLWKKSGFSELNKAILNDLDDLGPEKAITMIIKKLDQLVDQTRKEIDMNEFSPDRTEFNNMISVLSELNSDWAKETTINLKKKFSTWFYESELEGDY